MKQLILLVLALLMAFNATMAQVAPRKAKPKLELKGKSISEKIAFAEQIIKSMSGNKNFPKPSPSLSELEAEKDKLKEAATDVQAARQASEERSKNETETFTF